MLEIEKVYKEKFGETPSLFRSPGRVNIIGEHTDYNEGFVLPAAIDKNVYVAAGKRNDNIIHLYSISFKEDFAATIEDIKKSGEQWPNYILGVVDQFLKRKCILTGFNLVIDGDIPSGAGLSSSAAVECATAFALNELFNCGIDKIKMAYMAQQAEHIFAGVNCGIMDQFASMMGKKDHAIKLDCRSMEYEYLPLNLEGYKIVLLDTDIHHNLASSEYNIRRQQCERGVAMLKQFYPSVASLRDVTIEMLDKYVKRVDQLIYRRCKFILEENERLLDACEYLKRGNIKALGKKMFESHAGLNKDYEVSCPELDFLVDAVSNRNDVAGARMMGGGFGGCTINIVKENAVDVLINEVGAVYAKEMGIILKAYIANTADGASVYELRATSHEP